MNWLASLAALMAAGTACASPLLHAVRAGETAEVERLLAGGADPNAKNRYGVAPLSIACEGGDARAVAALLSAGADPNVLLRGGETALMTAARTGLPGPVRDLLSAGADVDARNGAGETALMWAAAEGHAEVVKQLLGAGAKRDLALGSGYNAWFFAAREGRGAVIDVLLESGVDVGLAMETGNRNWGRRPTKGTTALILAVENGHFELAGRLLDAGADPDDQACGFTPLHVLSWVRKPRRGDNIDGAPPPRPSGSMTSLELVDALIEHGADVNAPLKSGPSGKHRLGRPGSTPFLLAARTGDLPYMKRLLKHGADPHMPNDQGRTPLLAAAGVALGPEMDEAADEPSAMAAVAFLLDLGADIDVVDKEGETVMHSAAYKQSPGMVRLLAERGADIGVWNRKNSSGWTPLLIAQGFRNGNYKPSAPTIAAISEVMVANGVTPPPAPPPPGTQKREKYQAGR